MDRELSVTSVADVKSKVSDVTVTGNPDHWQLLAKASSDSQGWMKSTKAMAVPGGVVLQVSTQQRGTGNGNWAVAEAVTFVPGVQIVPDDNNGKKLAQA